MKIWLVNTPDPLVFQNADVRQRRALLLAKTLASRGHKVRWFTSTFDHISKRPRDRRVADEQARQEGLELHWLPTRGYRRNISLGRLLDEARLRRELERAMLELPPPDLIVGTYPVIDLCQATTSYARRQGVPVVYDVRDWWPDTFIHGVPRSLRWASRPLIAWYGRKAREGLAGGTAILGITKEFVDWGVAKAGRSRNAWDRDFPLAYPQTEAAPDTREKAVAFWRERNVGVADGGRVLAFVGTLGRSLAVEPILHAARQLATSHPQAIFVLCGDGERFQEYREVTAGLPNVVFPGWVSAAQAHELLRVSCLALNPMPDRPDYLGSINNKTPEYLAAGLPIVSSPRRGAVFRLLQENGCGASYDSGSASGLLAVLQELLDDEVGRKRMAEQARRLYESKFVAEKVYAAMVDHLETIAEEHRRNRPSH